jgi:chromosome segregation protein
VEEQLQAHRRLHERDQVEGQRIAEEMVQLQTRAEETSTKAESGREQLRVILSKRSGANERVGEANTQAERASEVLVRERANVDGGSGHFEKLLEERQDLALGVQRVQMRRDELVRALLDEFQQPLQDLARSYNLAAADAQLEEQDFVALEAEVAKLRTTLDRIGAVNLDAVEELSERQQREEFLARERNDLVEAKRNLLETIDSLDARCRERFLEVFESVQGQFEGIFRRLFRGGKAELVLEENADPLTAGIDISARPPGKKLRSIKLLSGGERTLTALALLLAVFRSKPSPFCLLDEVDASLDDANVVRFLDVIDDFIGETQFLVVTHNKLTMARCQRLFGVTMRKAGVSMVVAVDLSDIAENDDGTVSRIGAGDVARVITTRQDRLPKMGERTTTVVPIAEASAELE